MTDFIRVRDRESGHEYDLPETAFREDAHVKVHAPKQYPALTSPSARRVTARPAKHRTTKAGEPTAGSGDTNTEEPGR